MKAIILTTLVALVPCLVASAGPPRPVDSSTAERMLYEAASWDGIHTFPFSYEAEFEQTVLARVGPPDGYVEPEMPQAMSAMEREAFARDQTPRMLLEARRWPYKPLASPEVGVSRIRYFSYDDVRGAVISSPRGNFDVRLVDGIPHQKTVDNHPVASGLLGVPVGSVAANGGVMVFDPREFQFRLASAAAPELKGAIDYQLIDNGDDKVEIIARRWSGSSTGQGRLFQTYRFILARVLDEPTMRLVGVSHRAELRDAETVFTIGYERISRPHDGRRFALPTRIEAVTSHPRNRDPSKPNTGRIDVRRCVFTIQSGTLKWSESDKPGLVKQEHDKLLSGPIVGSPLGGVSDWKPAEGPLAHSTETVPSVSRRAVWSFAMLTLLAVLVLGVFLRRREATRV
jgi:hypothetical protein